MKHPILTHEKSGTTLYWPSLVISIILLIVKLYVSLSFIPDISGSEGSTILPVQRLLADLPVYIDPQDIPFLITQYTPIYFILTSWISELFGILPEEVHKIFIVSRYFSVLLTSTATILLGLFFYLKIRIQKSLAIVAACFIFEILAYWFLTSSRPDSLMILLTTLYVIAVHRAITNPNKNWWFTAMLIAVTAFFTKQNGAVHIICILLFLLVEKRYSRFFKVVLSAAFFTAVYILILPVPTFHAFFQNVVGGVSNSVSWGWFYDWTLQKLLLPFAPLLALNLVITLFVLKRPEHDFLKFLSLAGIVFFTFSTLFSLKIGAGVGYYQGYLVVTVTQIVTFFAKPEVREQFQNRFYSPFVSSYATIVAIHCLLFVYMRYTDVSLESHRGSYVNQKNVHLYLKDVLKLQDDELVYISEGSNFNGNYLKHFLYQNTIAPFSDIVFLGQKNGTFDYQKFDELVKRNRIKYVITQAGHAPVTILGHSFPDAKRMTNIGSYDVYQNF